MTDKLDTSEIQEILYGSSDPGAMAQYIRRKNKKRRLILDGEEAAAGPNDQELIFDPDFVWPWANGDHTIDETNTVMTAGAVSPNYYRGHVCPTTQGRDPADGGKYMFEMTVEGVDRNNDFAVIGLVKAEHAPTTDFSRNYAGDDYGCGCLFVIPTGGLCRIYVGATDIAYETGLPDTHIDTSGTSVITCAIDFDANTVIYYIDGVALNSATFVPQDGQDLLVKAKPYGSVVTTINPTILYPVDGYTKWA